LSLGRFSQVSGFVLAGGASRRMGHNKALLSFGSETVIDRQVHLLRAVCRSVSILGPPDKFSSSGVPVYGDEIPGKGPLSGIYTGLRRTRTEFSLFLSCDMPLMEQRFLRYLCREALASRALVTIPPPSAAGRYPLCAVLRRGTLPRVSLRLALGRHKVGRFFSQCPRRIISKAEFARAGFSSRMFCNLNTPEEYKRLRQQTIP